MNNGKISDKIAVIMGHSRSGTSWLGSIVNSHPDLIYRYEPFSNLRHFRSDIVKLRQDFQEGRVDETRLRQLYDILIKADPMCAQAAVLSEGLPHPHAIWSKDALADFPGGAQAHRGLVQLVIHALG